MSPGHKASEEKVLLDSAFLVVTLLLFWRQSIIFLNLA